MRRFTAKKILLITVVLLIVLLAGSFVWIFYGAPIHDLRLWIMERQFIRARISHPSESILLGRKSYLGPSFYGRACVYAVGEVRHVALPTSDVLIAYQNVNIGKLPLKIYFTDESELPYDVPFGEWQDGLVEIKTDTGYIVYIASRHHFLGDLRCDD